MAARQRDAHHHTATITRSELPTFPDDALKRHSFDALQREDDVARRDFALGWWAIAASLRTYYNELAVGDCDVQFSCHTIDERTRSAHHRAWPQCADDVVASLALSDDASRNLPWRMAAMDHLALALKHARFSSASKYRDAFTSEDVGDSLRSVLDVYLSHENRRAARNALNDRCRSATITVARVSAGAAQMVVLDNDAHPMPAEPIDDAFTISVEFDGTATARNDDDLHAVLYFWLYPKADVMHHQHHRRNDDSERSSISSSVLSCSAGSGVDSVLSDECE